MSIYDKASLVLIPSGTKTSKVYSQKPTNGDGDFTFSRSTAATRVNASGNIEKETQNLFLQSNNFSTTWTTNASASVTSGQAGYDGSNNAWKLVPNTSTSSHYVLQVFSVSGVRTISIYAKPSGYDYMLLYSGSNGGTFFDLVNGTITNNIGTTPIDATITSAGNGFYRCSIVVNAGNDVSIWPSPDGINYTYAGDGTSGILIQDAQVEQGLVARDYIETTTTAIYGGITDNVPRLDYTDSSCPALLLEPQRTNLYQHSEYIFNFQGTETFNAAVSPEGVSNAVLLTKTSASDQFVNMSWSGSSLSASTDYTMSLFVKHNGDDVDVRYEYNNSNDWGKGWNALFQVRASGVTASTTNLCTSDVEDYGNGWYRILVFVETASSITPSSPSNLLRVIGASGDDVLVYGAGMEQGSYATSYIPTYGSAVTRNQDDCENTNLDLLSQDAATYFLESTPIAIASNNILEVRGNGSTNDRLLMQTNSSGILRILVRNSGSTILDSNISSAVSAGTKIKVALKYTSTNISVFVDGVKKVDSDLSVNFGSPLDWINLEGTATANNDALEHHQFLFFPTALTDQEAIDLTTI